MRKRGERIIKVFSELESGRSDRQCSRLPSRAFLRAGVRAERAVGGMIAMIGPLCGAFKQ